MKKNLMIIALGLVVVLPAKAQWTKSSHGDRYLSHSSHHTQVPVPTAITCPHGYNTICK